MRFSKKKEALLGLDICKGEKMNKEDLLNINPNNKKDFKKILIYGVIVFLIFVIGVISFAIYKNMHPSKEESILPPQVKQEPVFKKLPIEKNSSENTNENVEINTSEQTKKVENSNLQNIKKELMNNSKNNSSENVEKIKPKTNLVVKTIPKKTEIKKVQKIEKKYYIQVAALLKYKKPNKKFLNLIEKYGYKYKFYTVYIHKGNKKIRVTKVLIGPFSKKEAKENLAKVKKYITQNAYIFRIK